MNKEEKYKSYYILELLNSFSKKRVSEFEKPENVITSNIGHNDIITQMNNIGQTINSSVENTSETTNKKLDQILNNQTSKNKVINEEEILLPERYTTIINEIENLKNENKISNNKIETTNKIITILGTVIGLILTTLIFTINSQYNAIKDMNSSNLQTIQTEIKAINQRLDYQEKLNHLDIQNEVNNAIKNKK